jgi:hypothetical protein
MSKYTKAWTALVAGLIVAIPAYNAALVGGVSLGEWLTLLGLFLPAVGVALSPANKLDTGDLIKQVNANPDTTLVKPAEVVINPGAAGKPLA